MPFEVAPSPEDAEGRVVIVHLSVPATFGGVREALETLTSGPVLAAVPEADRGTAEIVLAEAMNNIVEHAYIGTSGEITLTLWHSAGEVACRITDRGLSMPDERLPVGELATLATPANLPEGGFGWYLIRALSRDLRYARYGTLNELTFVLNAEQSRPEDVIVSTR
jgi:serine/threonine-protein kinase RsbW